MQQLAITLFGLALDPGTVAGLMIAIFGLLPILILMILYFLLAPYGIFFTFGKEECGQYVMVSNGQEWSGEIILSSKKNFINPITHDLEKITDASQQKTRKKFFGMYYVGIWPFATIYKYHMEWGEWQQTEDGYVLKLRSEWTPYLYFKKVEYGLKIQAAETLEQYPIDLGVALYVRAVNAYTPIFGNKKSFEQMMTLVTAQITAYIKAHEFMTLSTQKKGPNDESENEHDDFSVFICRLNHYIAGESGAGIEEKLGFTIEAAKILSIAVVGDKQKEIEAAILQKAIALQQSQADALIGKGKADAYRLMTEAEKERGDVYNTSPGLIQVDKAHEMAKLSGTYIESGSGSGVTPVIPIGGADKKKD